LSEEEFWRLTLRKFHALVGRLSVRLEREDSRAAQICAAIYEQNRDRKKKATPYTAADFMATKKKTGWKEQLNLIKSINVKLKGKNLKDV